ncbi:Ger(x)C family spore germination protein [Syntrophomonas palmitatica]|uniref:Ger(x)C family spore germination protein n=1 Tax=Syntrophomonas palmitatica TaxID=402877 RepID=UPI00155DB1BC|nr:Ger(x)C family spore germination protein [Syntrophomonas palmitatica]
MYKHLLLILLAGSLCFLSGCWNLTEVNDTSVCSAIGVDLSEDNLIDAAFQMVQTQGSNESGSGSQLQVLNIYGSGPTPSYAARQSFLTFSRLPLWADSRAYIIGEELARYDLTLIADHLGRNRNVRKTSLVAVAHNCTAKDVLNVPENFVGSSVMHLDRLLDLQEELYGAYVPVTLSSFISDLLTPGIEPVLPQLIIAKSKPQPEIRLDGMAVFKANKMVGSLNEKESRGYRWLHSRIRKGGLLNIRSPLNEKDTVTLSVIAFSSKSKPEIDENGIIKMKIEVDARLGFYDINGQGELLTPETAPLVEARANQEIKNQIDAAIKKSQALGSDIWGWGRMLQKYQPQTWESTASDWDTTFPVVASDIKVKTLLTRSYLTGKAFSYK